MVECIWDHFITACNSVQNGLKWCNYCKSSCHEVGSEFFATNAPDPPHWTQNSWFGTFHTVCVHLGPFHYCMKLGAKRAELVQLMWKFVPRSRFVISQNDCDRSIPCDPKLIFWSISLCSGGFGNFSLWQYTRCKTGWSAAINAKVYAMRSQRKFSQQMHPIHLIGS